MSTSKKGDKQRIIVYIDGYNLYYGLRDGFGNKYKWLDLQALAVNIMRPNMELVSVKYFTAITKSTTRSKQRQEIYLKALRVSNEKLEIYLGRFLSKTKTCRSCNGTYQLFEEKKTDVNIACHILNDAYQDKFDCCYVISGDSDLVPPLELIKQYHPNKSSLIAHPPKRKSTELCNTANGWFALNKQKFIQSQLPVEIAIPQGRVLRKPPEWG